MPVYIGCSKAVHDILKQKYRPPSREILVDPLTWDFAQRDPDDGLDRLIEDGIEPFEQVPKPNARAINRARRELARNPKLKHKRFTERCAAELAYSTATVKLRIKPTVLAMRAMLALRAALPQCALQPETEVIAGLNK